MTSCFRLSLLGITLAVAATLQAGEKKSDSGARPGSKNSTDPEGLIKQPYHYPQATGGFLLVTVGEQSPEQAELKIKFYDDTGEQMHSVTKTAEVKK